MKFIHLSDLHIGKRLESYSLHEDQKYILGEIMKIITEEKPDAVVIAGDVYDKPVPPAEAVSLFSGFLADMLGIVPHIYMIPGNHDSAERVAFGSDIFDRAGLHISPVYSGSACKNTIEDEYGKINIYLLPFVNPANVRKCFPDEEIATYTQAVDVAVRKMEVNTDERNIIVTHQFVTGGVRSDSEITSVGGSDNVDAYVFDDFDYVALGHLHRPQYIERESVRYGGTPLKYSLNEKDHEKSVTVVEMREKGETEIREVPLKALREVRELKGSYNELMDRSYYTGTTYRDDYVQITLTDEDDIHDAAAKLAMVYRNYIGIRYDNSRTRACASYEDVPEDADEKTPEEMFCDFYRNQNGADMDDEKKEYLEALIKEIWEAAE